MIGDQTIYVIIVTIDDGQAKRQKVECAYRSKVRAENYCDVASKCMDERCNGESISYRIEAVELS